MPCIEPIFEHDGIFRSFCRSLYSAWRSGKFPAHSRCSLITRGHFRSVLFTPFSLSLDGEATASSTPVNCLGYNRSKLHPRLWSLARRRRVGRQKLRAVVLFRRGYLRQFERTDERPTERAVCSWKFRGGFSAVASRAIAQKYKRSAVVTYGSFTYTRHTCQLP